MTRPDWAETSDEMRSYYDNEWGVPVRDTRGVFEALALEVFQVGLSWDLVLRRRDALRAAFAGFDPATVAAFGEDDVARLVADATIIRNRRKVRATIQNAQATLALAERGIDLADVVWSCRPDDPHAGPDATPSQSPESRALSSRLHAEGFTLVGPVTMYALMECIGVLDHRGGDGPITPEPEPAPSTSGDADRRVLS